MDSRTSRTIDGRTQSGFRDEAEAKAECDSYAETGEGVKGQGQYP
jgi:hypothetical protein